MMGAFSEPRGRLELLILGLEDRYTSHCANGAKAEDGARSRNPQIGNLMLYQLSYFRKSAWGELNPRPLHGKQAC